MAEPYDNPFDSLVALYIVAKIPQRGIVIKQAGKVELNPQTGQLVSTFDDLPQVPFETFKLHFNEGNRAPLVMPSRCGTYELTAKFTPWSAEDPNNPTPDEVITETSPFSVDQGCPSGTPPFKPSFVAGTSNNSAGSYSPFNLRITRSDDEQEFSRFSVKLPKGVIGKLAGIPFCSDAAIAAAQGADWAQRRSGRARHPELPGCFSNRAHARRSRGRTRPDLRARQGLPCGTVRGRAALASPRSRRPKPVPSTSARGDPHRPRSTPKRPKSPSTASGSDPIPHILGGIPVHARDIRVSSTRPDFVLNPTNCERTSTSRLDS